MHTHPNQEYPEAEERANTLTHALGVLLSACGMVLLLLQSIPSEWASPVHSLQIFSVTLFGCSLLALYLASTLYHAARAPEQKHRFKMWDHCAIYLLIAGTYTPYLLITLRDSVGWLFFGIIWSIAALGILLKIQFKHRFKLLRVATYLVMGWLVVLSFDELQASLASGGLNLLIAGGLAYTGGVIFYLNKRIPYSHAIWHLFVLAGSVCHFLSIYLYVIPSV